MITPIDLPARFARVPANRRLGLRLLARSPGGAEIAMDVEADQVQGAGAIHGGYIAALADTAAVYALEPDLEAGATMVSIEFKVNFLRPARPDLGPLRARSRLVRRGRRIGVCDVEVTQGDERIACGLFTYLIDAGDAPGGEHR